MKTEFFNKNHTSDLDREVFRSFLYFVRFVKRSLIIRGFYAVTLLDTYQNAMRKLSFSFITFTGWEI